MKIIVLFFLLLVMPVTYVWAQNAGQPVSIEASDKLEWLRTDNKYRATRDVVITQGDTIIRSDIAEALYDPAQGPSALTAIDVTGHVTITKQDTMITAETGHYDVATQEVTLNGQQVTLTGPKATLVSKGPVHYFPSENKAVGTGGVTITQPGQRLKADTLTAWFSPQTKQLLRATAETNVIVTHDGATNNKTEQDIIQAARADYNAETNKISLDGHVRVTRGQNIMTGDHGEVDVKTGTSTLSGTKKGGRVQALFGQASKNGGLAPTQAVAVPLVPGKRNAEQPYAVSQDQTIDPDDVKDPLKGIVQ